MAITFDEKLEAAWGLHKIEKAVLEKEIAELRAENEKLREALKPFANILNGIPKNYDEGWTDMTITVGNVAVKHLRAASAAIKDIERL
jgi:hypothetical protein